MISNHKISAKKRAKIRIYADLAREIGLSCPVGRAAYLVNRLENTGIGPYEWRLGGKLRYEHIEQEIMARTRPTTAKKWLAQFKVGVNLRRSIEGWAQYERDGQRPHGCYAHGAHAGTREDPYQHDSRAAARNCWERHCRRQTRAARLEKVTETIK